MNSIGHLQDGLNSPLPDHINKKRRKNLAFFTILAMLSYQLPVGCLYIAKFLGIGKYSYLVVNRCYFSYMVCTTTALLFIFLKKEISKRYIYVILHYQVVICYLVTVYMIYSVNDQRYLVPIGCLCILMFVFTQSSLLVSSFVIFAFVSVYLGVSYVGIVLHHQAGTFYGELIYGLVITPVYFFIAYMSKRMQDQQKEIKKTNKTLKMAHTELAAAHSELADTHNKLESTHTDLEFAHVELSEYSTRMTESIKYAEMIQRSLLPGIDRIKVLGPESMFIWMPKDIVGGDIFYTFADPSGSIIALMDCTGHGVPGAFLTMIAYSEIRKIIMDEGCRDPAEILGRLNRAVKNVLYRNNDGTDADDGLDAAVCVINHEEKQVIFAGAKIPLFYVKNGMFHKKNGDKQSIGYRHSDDHFVFTNHIIAVDDTGSFYLKTDGFTDQLGGEKRLRFGSERFRKNVMDHYDKSFNDQRKLFLNDLLEYKGEIPQMDDVTLIGFQL